MRQGLLLGAAAALVLAVALWAGTAAGEGRDEGARGAGLNSPPPRLTEAGALAEARALPSSQLVGQHLIASYQGLEPPQRLLRLIEQGRVAGVIFYGSNINNDKALIRNVVDELQAANEKAGPPLSELPLLMMTDQEGGEVRRLPGAPLSSAAQIGAAAFTRNVKAANAGLGAGRNMASVGMNVNLAPVLGVRRSRAGFLGQFQRAFGSNRRKVSAMASAFLAAQQSQGVAATAKHFPGLGAAQRNQDTDVRPVTLHLPKHRIRHRDEYPYHEAVASGVDLVMLNHARYPTLDRRRPASLSTKIVRGELRQRIGFDGVTITDALNAGALEPFGGTKKRALLASRAGDDLLLLASQKVNESVNAHAGLLGALRRGTLKPGPFERAAARILQLRAGLGSGQP